MRETELTKEECPVCGSHGQVKMKLEDGTVLKLCKSCEFTTEVSS